jgi:hypothetical protein
MKLLITFALALGLATTHLATPAHACGGYRPSPEQQVRWAFASEFAKHVYKPIHAITFLDEDTAQVELRWGQKTDRVIVQYAWLELDARGEWKRAGMSYTRTVWLKTTSSTPAVAAR